MNRQQILQIASKSPQFQQGVQALEQQMQANPITPKQLAELIKMMEFALSHPKSYPQIVQAAIKDGYTQPGDMPEQFDPTVIVSILAALYIVQDKMGKPQGMARGGSVDNFNAIQGLDVGGFKISPSKLHWVTTPTGRFLSGGTGPNTGYAGTGNLMADRSKFAYDPEYVDPNRAEVYSGLWMDGGAGADVDYAIKNYVMRNAFDANKDNPAEVKRLMTKYGVSASDLGAATQGMPVGSNVGSLFSQHYNPATSVPYTGQADIPKYIQDNAATFGSDFGGQHNWSNEDFAKYYNSAGGSHDSGSFDDQMKSEQWRRNAVEQLDTQKRKNDNFGNAEAWYTAKPSAMARGGLMAYASGGSVDAPKTWAIDPSALSSTGSIPNAPKAWNMRPEDVVSQGLASEGLRPSMSLAGVTPNKAAPMLSPGWWAAYRDVRYSPEYLAGVKRDDAIRNLYAGSAGNPQAFLEGLRKGNFNVSDLGSSMFGATGNAGNMTDSPLARDYLRQAGAKDGEFGMKVWSDDEISNYLAWKGAQSSPWNPELQSTAWKQQGTTDNALNLSAQRALDRNLYQHSNPLTPRGPAEWEGDWRARMAAKAAPPTPLARGGLAQAARQLQSRGRHGDTMLAHINPREAMMLRQAGGSGGINPQTGLPEFFNLGSFLGAIIPIAVAVFAPYLAPAIGATFGATGIGAGMLGSAMIGAGSAALSGGNIGQGALLGGLGGGLGEAVGGMANEGLSLGLGEAGAKTLGSGLVGGAAGALTGQGILQGAAQGAIGQYMGSQVGGSPGMENAGQTFGNMMTAGYDPKSAVLAGGLSGLATSFMGPSTPAAKPSDVVLDALKDPSKLTGTELTSQGELNAPTSPLPKAPTPTTSMNTPGFTGSEIDLGFRGPTPTTSMGTEGFQGAQSSPWNLKNAMLGMSALSMLQDAPQEVKQAVSTLSPEQKKYFNLPSVTWDWNRMQQDANKAGMSLSQFMAQSWPQITGYAQGNQNGNPSSMSGAYNKPAPPPRKLAQGGPLSQIAYMAQGSGTGRADTIDAKLSDGEYVMDAETVALLGDGSNKAGAQRLDAMRGAIRSHKGRTLAKGKFSPAAKSPLAYLKGAR